MAMTGDGKAMNGAGWAQGTRLPLWMTAAAGLAAAWNVFGLWQFAGTLTDTAESLMAKGMTAAQAEVYLGLPGWATVAFAVGVLGGLVGSVLILLRRTVAVPVLVASLAGYIVLYAADAAYGVFAAIPGQMAILSVVVAIAAGTLVLGVLARRRRLLA